MAKQIKSVWGEPNKEKNPNVYKIIKDEDVEALIKDFDAIEDDFDYELGYDDEY
jgi:hypothetical protein